MSYFRAFKSLHAFSQELITSMSWGTGYSAPRRVTSIPPSYHHVLTPCLSMLLEQTSKQPFGSEVCNATLWHPPSDLQEDSNNFAIDWMSGDPAPTAVLELLSCSYKRSFQILTCSCLASGLKCMDVCKLLDGGNRWGDSIEEVVSDNSDKDSI